MGKKATRIYPLTTSSITARGGAPFLSRRHQKEKKERGRFSSLDKCGTLSERGKEEGEEVVPVGGISAGGCGGGRKILNKKREPERSPFFLFQPQSYAGIR